MTSHPSDLALERLLQGEPSPPGAMAHLRACEACWSRWEHLHADEGWAPPARPALPAPANNNTWAPWAIAATSAGIALAASALLLSRPVSTAEEVNQLREEVETLRLEISQARGGSLRTPKGASQPDEAGAKTRPVEVATGAGGVGHTSPKLSGQPAYLGVGPGEAQSTKVSPQVVKAAVEAALNTKAQEAAEQSVMTLEWHADRIDKQIATATSELVASGVLSNQDAAEVEALLVDEREEAWELKESSIRGFLSEKDGILDWKSLVAETDEALLDYLSEEDLKRLRGAIQGK